MPKKLSRVLAIVGSLALAAFVAVGAQAHPIEHTAEYPTEPLHHTAMYHLRVEWPDGTVRETVLACPGGGAHPYGAAACDQLAEVNGEVSALTSSDRTCAMDYRPVTVRAHGMWNGRFHAYQGRFGNYCVAVGYTGGLLFDIASA